jgi:hypothetical protein
MNAEPRSTRRIKAERDASDGCEGDGKVTCDDETPVPLGHNCVGNAVHCDAYLLGSWELVLGRTTGFTEQELGETAGK